MGAEGKEVPLVHRPGQIGIGGGYAMNPESDAVNRNKVLVRRFVAAMNARDLDALDDLVAADVVRHCPATPDVVVTNLEQFKEFLRQDLRGVPDSVVGIQMMVADADLVGLWATYRGTQDGPMGPFPATGGAIDVEFASILRIANERIAEMWVVWDNLGMLIGLGHLAPPGSGA